MSKGTAKGQSPIPVIRNIKEITDEYGSMCAKSGEAHFKIKALEADIIHFNKRLVELNVEYKSASDYIKRRAEQDAEDEAAKIEDATLEDPAIA